MSILMYVVLFCAASHACLTGCLTACRNHDGFISNQFDCY